MAEQLKALAIEDDVGDGEILRLNLEDVQEWQVDFRRVGNGSDALQALEEAPADVIFVDYHLGAENGIDVLKVLRESGYERAIVFLTGAADEQVIVDAFRNGADDYLPKSSLNSQDLRRTVGSAIRKCSLGAELQEQKHQLAKVHRDLHKRNAEIRGYHQLLSQELKTPLTTALAVLELLTDGLSGPVTATQSEDLMLVTESCAQIADCIDDLLETTRGKSGEVSLRTKPESIEDLIESSMTPLGPVADAKGIRLSTKVAPNLPRVLADKLRIRQVLTNLLSNALKFADRGCQIAVLAEVAGQDPEVVQISVAGAGGGMDPERIDSAFDSMDPSEAGDGALGLGLSICKDLIELHDGSIWGVSTPGIGTTLSFTLPRYQGDSIRAETPAKQKILVVEDDKAIARSLAIHLEAEGYETLQAFDGAMGMALAESYRPDLMVLDIAMPTASGFAVAERVRGLTDREAVPIVFLTATRSEGLRRQAESLGAAAFLEKPCPAQRLLEAVQTALQPRAEAVREETATRTG